MNQTLDLETITDEAVSKLSNILDSLQIEYRETPKGFAGKCPVHEGDNITAWNIFKDGRNIKGNWVCYTHNCHRPTSEGGWGQSLFDFVRAILSKENKRKCSFTDGVEYVRKVLGLNGVIKIRSASKEKKSYIDLIDSLLKKEQKKKPLVDRKYVRSLLKIPSDYFLNRGFEERILDRYDVGDCLTQGKPMYKRAVVPIYDENGRYVGCLGRSIYEECKSCKGYHSPEGCLKYPKWRVQTGFNDKHHLYNFHNAKEFVYKTGKIILVEGPADVWKLEQFGIFNSVAVFGTKISEEQQEILEKSGASYIDLCLDNDVPGREGCEIIKRKLKKLFSINEVKYSCHDIGSINKKEVELLWF